MSLVEEHCAAMAAKLLDAELAAILMRMPQSADKAPYHRAVLKEAERRGIVEKQT